MYHQENIKSLSRLILFWISIVFWFFYHITFLGVIALWYAIIYSLEKVSGLKYSLKFETTILIFIILSSYLGTSLWFYDTFWWWDKMLHFVYGFCFAFIGYKIIFSFLEHKWIKNQFLILVMFSFCFSVSLWAIWEIVEYLFDRIGIWYFWIEYWAPLVQTNPASWEDAINDTMHDIMIETFSTLIINIMMYCYYKFWIFTFFKTFNLTLEQSKKKIQKKFKSLKLRNIYKKRIQKIIKR